VVERGRTQPGLGSGNGGAISRTIARGGEHDVSGRQRERRKSEMKRGKKEFFSLSREGMQRELK